MNTDPQNVELEEEFDEDIDNGWVSEVPSGDAALQLQELIQFPLDDLEEQVREEVQRADDEAPRLVQIVRDMYPLALTPLAYADIEVLNRLHFVRKHGLSVGRCHLALLVRAGMSTITGVCTPWRGGLARAWGNLLGLLQSMRARHVQPGGKR